MVRAVDPELVRDAYGAEIHVQVDGKGWLQSINPGYSYLSSNDPRAHFGLGKVDHVDSITVIWPDGARERFPGLAAGARAVIYKGDGQMSP